MPTFSDSSLEGLDLCHLTGGLLCLSAIQILLGLIFTIIYVLDLLAQLLRRDRLGLCLVDRRRYGADALILLVVGRGFQG